MSNQLCVNCGTGAGYPHAPQCRRPKYCGEPDPIYNQNVATPAFLKAAAEGIGLKCWTNTALGRIKSSEPSMVIGRPGAPAEVLEDEGRTLVLPLPASCPKVYACINETGGATLMLAEEY